MKFTVAIITALILSLNQVVVTLGVQCDLCPNFDASRPIDMGQLDVMMTSREGPNGNLRRNLQIFQGYDDGEMEWISCAQISAGIEFMGSDNIDDATCGYFQMMAMMFCGCDGACSTCSDGSPYPDLDAIPNYEAWAEMDVDMGSDMEQSGTCRDLVTQLGAYSVLMSTFVEDPPLVDGSVNEDFTTMAPSKLDVGDMTAMFCGLAGVACGCPQVGCTLCESGFENPEFVPEIYDDDDFIMTCEQGAEMLIQMMGPMGMCNEAKLQFDDSGCLCKEMESGITSEVIDEEVVDEVVDVVVDEVVDEVIDDNTITNDTLAVEIPNSTEAPTRETPKDTSAEATSSGSGDIFALSLHSTKAATTTMFLAVFSLFLFV